MNPYTFLLDTYETERLKTLSVWSHFTDTDLGFRPEPRQGAPVIYRHESVEALLAAPQEGDVESPALPGPGAAPPTERPGRD